MPQSTTSRRLIPVLALLASAAASLAATTADAGLAVCLSGPCCDGLVFRPSKFVCRAATGGCDAEETCTGSSSSCPPDAIKPARTMCRASTGVCDRSEGCSGSSKDCPADGVRTAGSPCRAATGVCDVAETCDGFVKTCPADTLSGEGVLCRTANGDCDVEEVCSGTSASCPADAAEEAGVLCRKGIPPCDLEESCDGVSTSCPADATRNGEPCSEGDACLQDPGTCDGKTCVGVVPVDCDDDDPCTQDTCDAGDGGNCLHSPGDDGVPCDDGDECTKGDKCDTGTCVGAPILDCGGTTTTTLEPLVCGDVDGDGIVEASDALVALRASVGIGVCPMVVCDFNGNGSLTAGDALFILRLAVGNPETPNCPETEPTDSSGLASPAASTTTTTIEE